MASAQKQRQPQLTHFLCIPLVTPTSRPQLSASLNAFRNDTTGAKALGGFDLPAEAVRPVGTLHLTLGMMSFPEKENLQKAVGLLKSIKPREILAEMGESARSEAAGQTTTRRETNNTQILLTLKGLNSMQKPERATVLYAPPADQDGLLQDFAERIQTVFKQAGLLVPDDRALLLHATIVNTIYVKGGRGSSKGNKWTRNVISDAQAIMDRYGDQIWMEHVPLEKIAICRMGAKPVIKDGVVVDTAYETEAEIDF